jgi:hypothetical protein
MSDDSLHGGRSDISQRNNCLDREWRGINHGRSDDINTNLYSGSRRCRHGSDIDIDSNRRLRLRSCHRHKTADDLGYTDGQCRSCSRDMPDFSLYGE